MVMVLLLLSLGGGLVLVFGFSLFAAIESKVAESLLTTFIWYCFILKIMFCVHLGSDIFTF